MRKTLASRAWPLIGLLFLMACGPRCLDDVRDQVMGKTAAEVKSFLGRPNYLQPTVLSGERWIWEYSIYADGSCPRRQGGEVADLQIIFDRVGSDLRVTDRLSVSAVPHQTAER